MPLAPLPPSLSVVTREAKGDALNCENTPRLWGEGGGGNVISQESIVAPTREVMDPKLIIRRKEHMGRPEVNIRSQPAPDGVTMW